MNGLQYKENLTIISGGYAGEDVGSSGLVQDWTNVPASSGSSTVTYHYRDSVQADNNNSSQVNVQITDSWSATVLTDNTIRVQVTTVINSIDRVRIGNPGAFSTYMFVRQTAGGANIWTSGGCDDATTTHTVATNITVGSYTFDLPPQSSGSARGTVYYRSNTCGHDSDVPPSTYVDEFWMGINFRNTLPAPVLYTLNYDANGGSGAPATQTAYSTTGSCDFTVPNTSPTWGYYDFLGWSFTQYSDSRTEADVEYVAGDTVTLQQANPTRTLYAVWRMNYIPGKVWNGSDWLSHNRATNGHAKQYTGSAWSGDMYTVGNGIVTNDPPFIRYSDDWKTMKRIGTGA